MLHSTTIGRTSLLMNEPSLAELAQKETIVLCVHGMYGGAWYFIPWLENYRHEGLGAVALNLRGHHGAELALGQTLDDVTMQDYVNDVGYAMATLQGAAVAPKRVILLGHSMGGLVAQMYAANHEVGGLVLVASTVPKYRIPHRFLSSLPILLHFRMRAATDRGDMTTLLPPDEGRARQLFAGIPEPLMTETIARLVPESARARSEVAQGIHLDWHVPHPPALIVAGERDQIVPSSLLLALHLSTPDSTFLSCSSGHFPMLEPIAELIAHQIALWILATVR